MGVSGSVFHGAWMAWNLSSVAHRFTVFDVGPTSLILVVDFCWHGKLSHVKIVSALTRGPTLSVRHL